MGLINITKSHATEVCLWFCREKFTQKTVHTKSIGFSWNYKYLKDNDLFPQISYRNNGASKSRGDKCFDSTIVIGYLFISYTNWNLQK